MLLDDTLRVLSNRYRRFAMYSVRDMDSDVFTYDELLEDMVDEDYLDPVEVSRFRVQMEQDHLPVMQHSGLIEYDDRSDTIRRVPSEDVYELLDFLEKFED